MTANATGVSYQWINCNTGGAAIPGQTNPTFSPGANGSYAVILSQGNCSDTSSCHNIIILGSDESGFKNEFVIYPNPTDGNFSIYSIKLLESVNIEIKDVFGRIIFKGNYNGKKWDFVIQEKSGIYFVTTQSKYDLRVF